MRVLHVSSEVAPFAQTGGLADVVAGLPAALAEHAGVDVAVLVPLYRGVAERLATAGVALAEGARRTAWLGAARYDIAIRVAQVGRVRYGFVDCPRLYDREGSLYGPGGASEFGDNHLRFGILGKAATIAGEVLLGGVPDVLHVHDWQGGPAALYARLSSMPSAIIATIHNLAFRGIFGKHVMTDLGLPWSLFTTRQLEFYDQVSLLKGALAVADAVTTVSPTYAREILTPARGEALDGFLREDVRRLVGIVNGIDADAWDPATDRHLPAAFSVDDLAPRAQCRRVVAAEAGLALDDGDVLIGAIARMSDQKGLDLVADVVPLLAALRARLIVLGNGEPQLEERFRWLARTFSRHVSVRIGFDIGYARRIYGGTDLFAMPSRFEPCGLGQLYAMRYGSIPIVHAVGGLRDTVDDPGDDELARGNGTGFKFERATPDAMHLALVRAVRVARDADAIAAIRRSAMARDSSWQKPAAQYLELYRSVR